MKAQFLTLLLFAGLFMTSIQTTFAQAADQKAIQSVVERETSSWIKRDVKAMTDCWVKLPESSHLYSIPDGNVVHITDLDKGVQELVANQKPNNDTFKNTNYKIRVNGNAAYAQFDQEYISENGSKNYSHQNRYLEKFGNDWKIINAVVVYYNPQK